MLLSQIQLTPCVDGSEKALFLGGEKSERGLLVRDGKSVSFFTFFNAFPAKIIREYSDIPKVKLFLEFKGELEVTIKARTVVGKVKDMEIGFEEEVLHNGIYHDGGIFTVDTTMGDLIGFEVKSEFGAEIFGGRWECSDEYDINKVRLGIVICTYKREKNLLENVKRITDKFSNNELDIYVVDNGQTLKSLPTGAQLIKNANLGGSGGFSRGMYECVKKGNTHFLLMDDDIVFFAETISRIISFLRVLKQGKTDVQIGSSMLSFSNPDIVYESGAFVGNARLGLPKHNINITKQRGLMWCSQKGKVNYSGWWFYCAPIKAVLENGLSMPFFIKYDDAEFGLRLSGKYMLEFPIGIGVWHQEFETKLPPYLYYYLRRNCLITYALNGSGIYNAVVKLIGSFFSFAFKNKVTMEYIYKGYEDYLSSADFLLSIDGEALNTTLRNGEVKGRGIVNSFFKMFGIIVRLLLKGRSVGKSYQKNRIKLCEIGEWEKRFTTN